jgi:hypothetical protein
MKKFASILPHSSKSHSCTRRLGACVFGASLFLAGLAGARAENPWGSGGAWSSSWDTIGGGSFGSLPWESRHFSSSTFSEPPPVPIHDASIDPAMIKAGAIAEHRAEPHSTNFCWRYVKEALVAAGSVTSYPRTAYAREAGHELVENYGFVKLAVSSPDRAPVGSVLVYGGSVAGHVELRTVHGFVSDYRCSQPSTLPFIGAYALVGGKHHKEISRDLTTVQNSSPTARSHRHIAQSSASSAVPGTQIPHGVIAATL